MLARARLRACKIYTHKLCHMTVLSVHGVAAIKYQNHIYRIYIYRERERAAHYSATVHPRLQRRTAACVHVKVSLLGSQWVQLDMFSEVFGSTLTKRCPTSIHLDIFRKVFGATFAKRVKGEGFPANSKKLQRKVEEHKYFLDGCFTSVSANKE